MKKMFYWLLALWFILYLVFLAWVGTATAGKQRILDVTNRWRVNRAEVSRVELDLRLSRRAKQWSEYMAVLGHIKDPGTNWLINSVRHVDGWRGVADSVGMSFPGGQPIDILRAMWRCNVHRLILSERMWTHVGIGIYRDDGGCIWLTLLFYG